jgi:hypothetical protein
VLRPSHRPVRFSCLVVACAAAFAVVGAPTGASAVTAPAYVTPLMAHTAWTATENCKPATGVVQLPGVLSGHTSRGFTLTGTVVTSWFKASTRNCIENLALSPFPKPILMPSWADLAGLRTTYPSTCTTTLHSTRTGDLDFGLNRGRDGEI